MSGEEDIEVSFEDPDFIDIDWGDIDDGWVGELDYDYSWEPPEDEPEPPSEERPEEPEREPWEGTGGIPRWEGWEPEAGAEDLPMKGF